MTTESDRKSLVQRQFGANAAHYVTSTVHAKGASLARLVELVRPHPGWQALDVATAAGHTALAFAPHVARVVASDITEEMLEEARKLAAERGLSGRIEVAHADAESLPFEDAHFDLVTCRIAPHHFPDCARFVGEAARVLKPGGTFALVDNVSPDAATTPGFSTRELKDAAITYNAFEKIRDPSHGRALTTGEWLELVGEAGFDIVHHELAAKAMDFAAWCRNMAVAPETAVRLEAMLASAAPALAAFLKPAVAEGAGGFELTELILVARKGG
jgi:ubiquinone/menaquinone biosynthesis C-methylase UbiE